MQVSKWLLSLGLCWAWAALVPATEPSCQDKTLGETAKDPLAAAFDRLKGLVGEWEQKAPADEAAKGKTTCQFKLTGGGSALVETILPGTNMEMLSVYHRDGDQLLMTHYCAAGNQPRMRAKLGKDKDELVFEFVGGGNMNAAKDLHIHGGVIRFVDADNVHSEWYVYRDGKEIGKHAFDLVRKKK